MRTLALVTLMALPMTLAWGAPDALTLAGIEDVQGLQRADVDGDGIVDLLLLSGRTLHVWQGRQGALPTAGPKWSHTLPAGVSFVSGAPVGSRASMSGAAVYTLGTDGMRVARLAADASTTEVEGVDALGWRDGEKATFADLARPGGLLRPHEDGWSWLRTDAKAADALRLTIPRFRSVKPPGPFLEDTCDITDALPEVFVGAAAHEGGGDALWTIAGGKLVAQARRARVTYDLGFLGAEDGGDFDQTLVDLDGDGRPEVLHRIFTNRQVHYGFFRTKPAAAGKTTGPTHRPAASTLSLQGFQLDPTFVDLDGDGRKDLVITSMQVNGANMMAALTSGKVMAETRAFLNRGDKDDAGYFVVTPDADVKSEIGVQVQFNYAGNVEVNRSLLIVLDGDYDGDGRKDLAIRTSPTNLSIHQGLAAGVWDANPRSVVIPDKGACPDVEGYAADLDGDKRDEMILVYRKPPGGRDVVRIVEP